MSNTPATDLFNKAKAWYQSKTIWGAILMLISMAVKTFFPEVDVEGAAQEIATSGEELALQVDSIWSGILGVFGFLLTVWGRIKAKTGIQ